MKDLDSRQPLAAPLKNGLFIYPLLSVWAGLTVLLFHCLLSAKLAVPDDLIRNLITGACISFCYLWGVYHWVIVCHHLLSRKSTPRNLSVICVERPRVAILYCLCDNLDREAIVSATNQDYLEFDVFLLDDSYTLQCQLEVDRLASEFGLSVFRREDRSGYKAGNVNHAIAKLDGQYTFVAINDADELLPPDFIQKCVSVLLSNPQLAFVQANHANRVVEDDSTFAKQMGVMTDVRWSFYREYANHAGTCFSLGHGLVLRTMAWREVGGYPAIVSEDIGMTLRLLATGWRGRFLRSVICQEQFSKTYSAFRQRFGRCVEADVECIKTEMPRFLHSSKPQLVEKLDALLRECRYPSKSLLLPLAVSLSVLVADGNLPAFLNHPTWIALNICILLSPWAPYFVALNLRQSVRFFGSSLWAFASLATAMLTAGMRTLARRPSFAVTFSRIKRHQNNATNWRETIIGILLVSVGLQLSSASLLLIGAALISVPLLSTETWWRSDVLSVYLPIVVLAGCIALGGIPSAAVVLLPLALLLY